MPEPQPGTFSKQVEWTQGTAKWVAAIVIGAASITGMVWSFAGWSGSTRATRSVQPPRIESASTPPPQPLVGTASATDTQHAGPRGPVLPELAVAPAPDTGSSIINVNTATQSQLELLPGIGPSLAQRIIEHREKFGVFRSIDELDRVKGIGPKILERIRPLVRVE